MTWLSVSYWSYLYLDQNYLVKFLTVCLFASNAFTLPFRFNLYYTEDTQPIKVSLYIPGRHPHQLYHPQVLCEFEQHPSLGPLTPSHPCHQLSPKDVGSLPSTEIFFNTIVVKYFSKQSWNIFQHNCQIFSKRNFLTADEPF